MLLLASVVALLAHSAGSLGSPAVGAPIGSPSWHSPGPPPPPTFVDPIEVTSLDGSIIATIEPTDCLGEGPADYRFESTDGTKRAHGRFGFTMHRCEFSGENVLVGYGLGGRNAQGASELVAAAVRSDGVLLWKHVIPIEFDWSTDRRTPRIRDMAVLHTAGRMVFLGTARDPRDKGSPAALRRWSLRLSDGACVDVRPATLQDAAEHWRETTESIDAIPGADLLVVTTLRRPTRGRDAQSSLRIRLEDSGGHTHWETSWNVAADKVPTREAQRRRRPHVFAVDPRGFDAWSPSLGTRTRFDLSRSADGLWTAQAGQSQAIAAPSDVPLDTALPKTLALEETARVSLKGFDPDWQPTLDETLWHPLPGGGRSVLRFRWAGEGEERVDLLTYDQSGRVVDQVEVGLLPNRTLPEASADWRYSEVLGWCLADERKGAFMVDPETGALDRHATWPQDLGSDAHIGVGPDGSLALAQPSESGELVVRSIDADGATRWKRTLGVAQSGAIENPMCVVYIDEDRMVLATHSDALWLVSQTGPPLGPWSLEEHVADEFWLARRPLRTPTGDLLLQSLGDTEPLAVVRVLDPLDDGPAFRLERALTPSFDDGSSAASMAESARIDHAGVLWSFDGSRWFPMTADGTIEPPVGAALPLAVLHEQGSCGLLDEHVAIRDSLTGAIHLWTHEGERALVAGPTLRDAEREEAQGRIRSGLDGSIWAGPFDDEIKTWRPNGERSETIALASLYPSGIAPSRRGAWVWEHLGGPVLRTRRGPYVPLLRNDSRRWLRRVTDVCELPNGEVVVTHACNDGVLPDGRTRPPAVEFVHYVPEGAEYRAVSSTRLSGSAGRLRATEHWLVAVASEGLLLQRRSSGKWFTVPMDTDGDLRALPVAGGAELLVLLPYEGELRRYRLPH